MFPEPQKYASSKLDILYPPEYIATLPYSTENEYSYVLYHFNQVTLVC